MPINQLAPTSKIWIYQSKSDFTSENEIFISQVLTEFVNSWQSHGAPIAGGFEIVDHRFIIIAADEQYTGASSCSIDKSVGAIRAIEDVLQAGLLDRGSLSFLNKDKIETIVFDAIKPAILEGTIKPETIIFNNNIEQLSMLQSQWKVAAAKTWLNRMFAKTKAV